MVLRKGDGLYVVSSDDVSAYRDEDNTISAAIFAIKDHADECDVFNWGEYFGTAKYMDMNPNCWFSDMQVVFSQVYQ